MSKQSVKSVHLLSKSQITYGTPLTVEPKPGSKARQLTAAAIALATAAANRLQAQSNTELRAARRTYFVSQLTLLPGKGGSML